MGYQINNTSFDYIGKPDWQDTAIGQSLAGETIKNRWKVHRWRTNIMPTAEYIALSEFEGQRVTLKTNDYADRNNQTLVTYSEAELRSVTGTSAGKNMANVVAEFRVRT